MKSKREGLSDGWIAFIMLMMLVAVIVIGIVLDQVRNTIFIESTEVSESAPAGKNVISKPSGTGTAAANGNNSGKLLVQGTSQPFESGYADNPQENNFFQIILTIFAFGLILALLIAWRLGLLKRFTVVQPIQNLTSRFHFRKKAPDEPFSSQTLQAKLYSAPPDSAIARHLRARGVKINPVRKVSRK